MKPVTVQLLDAQYRIFIRSLSETQRIRFSDELLRLAREIRMGELRLRRLRSVRYLSTRVARN